MLDHAGIRQVMVLSAITSILGRGVIELLPAFADAVFGRGSDGLAELTTAGGVGAIAGAPCCFPGSDSPGMPRLTRHRRALLGGW